MTRTKKTKPPIAAATKCAGPRGPFCVDLEERLEEPNAAAKGLVPLRWRARADGAVHVEGVAFKRDRKDRGLMLLFCPFCGAAIERPDAVAAGAAPNGTEA